MITSKEQLEATIAWANTWSGRSTLVLAAGILGEYVVLPFLDEKKWRNKVAKIVFALLVVSGIGGEYEFSSQISRTADELQRMSDGELRVALTNASTANDKASKAVDRATTAESHLADANQKAAEANARAKSFEVQIASANERAARAQQIAAEANLELEKIRTPRTITNQDQSEMVETLRPFAGTPYDLSVAADSESVNLMRIVQSILSKAGWVQVAVEGPIGLGKSSPLVGITLDTGVYVEIAQSKMPEWLNATDKLVGLLKEKGISAQGNAAQTGVEPNAMHIAIGKKP